jgi:hypothetical protein
VQDLRHLRDVTEHIRQVANSHPAAELLRVSHTRFQISERCLAVDEELVHQRLPRAEREPPCLHERANPCFRLRTDLEVVVNRRELPVQREAERLVALEPVEQLVDDLDE